MANTLLIQKLTGGYFGFVLNSEPAIKNFRNDLFAFGNQLHFKTANEANIIKQQEIYPENVTLIANGTFTFGSVDEVFEKLIDVGYFDWTIGGGTGGSGADKFTDLLDTFPSYIGRDMQCVVVDESQLKLKTVPFYNKQFITQMNDFEGVLQANKMVTTNASGTKFVLEDKPQPPQQFLNSVGNLDYNDLTTQTTPIPFLANTPIELTNDGQGDFTFLDNSPYGVSSVWNTSTNSFDFSQLTVGDIVFLRLDIDPTTTTANQFFKTYLTINQGTAEEYNLVLDKEHRKTGGNELSHVFTTVLDIRNDTIRTNPTKVMFVSDGPGEVKVIGWNVIILRKNINIVNIVSDVQNATSSVKGILKLTGDLGGTSDSPSVPALANKENVIPASSTNNVLVGNKTWVNLETWVKGFLNNNWFGDFVNNLAQKTVAINTDTFGIADSEDGFKAKKVSFGNTFKTINGLSIIGNGNLTIPTALATATATATTSGAVKTDITEVDPVVYTKTTIDNMLISIPTPTLQQVTDTGNFTNKQIFINTTLGTALGVKGNNYGIQTEGDWAGGFLFTDNGVGIVALSNNAVAGKFYIKNLTNNILECYYNDNTTDFLRFWITATGYANANAFIRNGGLATEFLKADGSVDSSNYIAGTGTNTYLPKFNGGALEDSRIKEEGNIVTFESNDIQSRIRLKNNAGGQIDIGLFGQYAYTFGQYFIFNDENFSYFKIFIENFGIGNVMRIANNGTMSLVPNNRLLVGTETDNGVDKLQVTGSVNVTGNLTVNTNTLFVDATNNRVGIGVLTPTKTLDVNGEVRIRTLPTGLSTDNIMVVNANGDIRKIAPTTGIAPTITNVSIVTDELIEYGDISKKTITVSGLLATNKNVVVLNNGANLDGGSNDFRFEGRANGDGQIVVFFENLKTGVMSAQTLEISVIQYS